MAAAGGHWTKAAGGPYAGNAVFVPAMKTFSPAIDIGGESLPAAITFEDAFSQGPLIAYQTINGKWMVMSKPPDPTPFFLSNHKDQALTKMQNMNANGMSKALGEKDLYKATTVTNSASFTKVQAKPADAPKAAGAAKAAEAAAKAGYKDVRDVYDDIYAADSAFANHFDVAAAKYTSRQLDALGYYQDGKYDYINSLLWKGYTAGNLDQVNGWVKELDGAMKAGPGLPHNTMLYRYKGSTSEAYTWAKAVKVGGTYQPKGFDSTTVDSKFDWTAKLTLRYQAPKGFKGFYMNAKGYSSSHEHEYEYLLPRNVQWRVAGKQVKENGQITIDLEWVDGGM